MLRFDIISLFPQVIDAYLQESILQRARRRRLIEVVLHDLRLFGVGRHRITDEPPFGGGGGMILRPDPIFAAVEHAQQQPPHEEQTPIILLTPQGRPFTQTVAAELAQQQRLILICGRYEGFDERIRHHLASDEISLGDFVLTGGEIAAMAIVDAVARLLPDVLGADSAAQNDSHASGLLEGPHYTKPVDFRGWQVPALLRSGDDRHIARWHRQQALRRTWQRRPDMLLSADLDEADRYFLATLAREHAQRSVSA